MSESDRSVDARLVNRVGDDLIFEFDNLKDENFLRFHDAVPGWTLPGRGKISNKIGRKARSEYRSDGSVHSVPAIIPCGTFKAMAMAEDLSENKVFLASCHKYTCPRCFREASRRQARLSAAYLWGVKEATRRQIYHITLAFDARKFPHPVGQDPLTFVDKLRSVARDFLVKNHDPAMGPLGASEVFHPWSVKCNNGHSAEDRGHEGRHLKPWYPECESEKETFYGWEWWWHPHFHYVTNFYVDMVPENAAIDLVISESEHNLHFSNISQNNAWKDAKLVYEGKLDPKLARKGYVESQEALEDILAYELGHALQYKDVQRKKLVQFGSWCAINFNCYWSREKQIRMSESGKPYRYVVAEAERIGEMLKIKVSLWENHPFWMYKKGQPWYSYESVLKCKVVPVRSWCDLHSRFERVDPCHRKEFDYDNAPLSYHLRRSLREAKLRDLHYSEIESRRIIRAEVSACVSMCKS